MKNKGLEILNHFWELMSGKLKKIIWNDKEMGTLVCGLQELEGLQYL